MPLLPLLMRVMLMHYLELERLKPPIPLMPRMVDLKHLVPQPLPLPMPFILHSDLLYPPNHGTGTSRPLSSYLIYFPSRYLSF